MPSKYRSVGSVSGPVTFVPGVGLTLESQLSYVAYVRVTFPALLSAFAVGLGATILAAVVPALRVAKMPVATALRQS